MRGGLSARSSSKLIGNADEWFDSCNCGSFVDPAEPLEGDHLPSMYSDRSIPTSCSMFKLRDVRISSGSPAFGFIARILHARRSKSRPRWNPQIPKISELRE